MAEPEVAVEGDQTSNRFPASAILPRLPPVHVKEEPLDEPINEYQFENTSQSLIELKNEAMETHQYLPDYTISASELMRSEKMIKKEEMDNENEEGMAAHYQPIFPDLLDLLGKESRMDVGTVALEKSYYAQSNNILHDHSYCTETRMDDGTVGEENSHHEEPSNILHDHTYCFVVQKNPSGNRSDAEMKCTKGEDRTQKASSRVTHLSKKHSTTPDKFDFANFTVTRPVMQANKTTPQCILCDIFEDYPSSLVEPKEESAENEILNQSEDSLVDEKLFRNDYENADPSEIQMKEPKEELFSDDYEIPHQNFLGDVEVKEEEILDDGSMFPGNSIGEEMNLDDGEARNGDLDTTDSVKNEKRRRSSRQASRAIQYDESVHSNGEDAGLSMKVSRSESSRKKRNSHKGEEESEDVIKNRRVSKKNETELECPECEYRTYSVNTWMAHLRFKHFTTIALAGLALLCECGNESVSDGHIRATNHCNTTVIRKRYGPILRLDNDKATVQCVLCEIYPKTAYGYVSHLRIHHKSTLMQNGVYLKCLCGLEVRCSYNNKHLEDCNPRQFTLHKLNDE